MRTQVNTPPPDAHTCAHIHTHTHAPSYNTNTHTHITQLHVLRTFYPQVVLDS
jgi:hypothetical protein